ncbi:MAG: hypothetical protein R2697_22255 [Ilumatobacteraceae bacterium]
MLKQVQYGGSVAASGLTGGLVCRRRCCRSSPCSSVNLLGIDSVEMDIERRQAAWGRIAADLKPSNLGAIGHDVTLNPTSTACSPVSSPARPRSQRRGAPLTLVVRGPVGGDRQTMHHTRPRARRRPPHRSSSGSPSRRWRAG